MTMADGTTKDVYYNGFTEQDDLKGFYGVESLGIENVKAYITRGVLVDVAGYKGVDTLDHSYEVTMDDVRGALARQGISEASINDGDALFFNYGWSKLWKDPDTYNTNPPGIGMEVAAWIVEQNASMVGSDTWPTEVCPSPTGLVVPVHQELITKAGIFNLENMVFESVIADGVYEFLYIFTPIRFKGGTGSPAARWQSGRRVHISAEKRDAPDRYEASPIFWLANKGDPEHASAPGLLLLFSGLRPNSVSVPTYFVSETVPTGVATLSRHA